MTIGIKVLGSNAYELSTAGSDTPVSLQRGLQLAVTGILDSGTYTDLDDNSLAQLDVGYLEDRSAKPVTVVEGTSLTVVTDSGLPAFGFNGSSALSLPINFSSGNWVYEFEYIRTSSTDWMRAYTSELNPITGQPYFQLTDIGTVIVSTSSGTYTSNFGSPSLNVKHSYAVEMYGNKLTLYVDGVIPLIESEVAVQWDVANSSSLFTFSNGNMSCTTNSGWYNARANTGVSSGLKYWELIVIAPGSTAMIGLALSNMVVSGNFGSVANTVGLCLGGNNWYNGTAITCVAPSSSYPAAAGNVYMFALDMDNKRMFMGLNGVWFNGANPSSGTATGAVLTNIPANTWYPAVSVAPSGFTIRSTSSNCGPLPTGYSYLGVGIFPSTVTVAGSLPTTDLTLVLGKTLANSRSSSTCVWNAATSNASFTISNSSKNLVSTTSGWTTARASKGFSSGKAYWEIRINDVASTNSMIGIMAAGSLINYPTNGVTGAGLYLGGNNWYNSTTATVVNPSTPYPATAGFVYMFALDMDNKRLFVGLNGVWYNSANPSAGTATGALLTGITPDTYYPGISTLGCNFTLNANPVELVYAPPAGFTAAGVSSIPSTYSTGKARNLRITKLARYLGQAYTINPSTFPTGSVDDTNWSFVDTYAAMNDAAGLTKFLALKARDASLDQLNNLDAGQFTDVQNMWELYDNVAGINAKCYRALTKDSTYKYVVLDTNTTGYILTKVYESWNSVTHVGLNLAYQSDDITQAQRTNLSNAINVFASSRWLALFGTAGTSGANSSLTGCFEISRDDEAEPVGTFPRFAWLSQYGLFGYNMPQQPWGILSGQTYNCFSLPRTINNDTGVNACTHQMTGSLANHVTVTNTNNSYTCTINSFQYQYWNGYGYSWATVYNATYPTVPLPAWKRLLEEMLPTGVNPWNTTNNNYVFSAYAVDTDPDNYNIRGRFYGLKLLANNVGASMDTINIKVDQDGMYNQMGNSVTHAVIKLSTGGCVAIPLSL